MTKSFEISNMFNYQPCFPWNDYTIYGNLHLFMNSVKRYLGGDNDKRGEEE